MYNVTKDIITPQLMAWNCTIRSFSGAFFSCCNGTLGTDSIDAFSVRDSIEQHYWLALAEKWDASFVIIHCDGVNYYATQMQTPTLFSKKR